MGSTYGRSVTLALASLPRLTLLKVQIISDPAGYCNYQISTLNHRKFIDGYLIEIQHRVSIVDQRVIKSGLSLIFSVS
jgi:hypothetical protein